MKTLFSVLCLAAMALPAAAQETLVERVARIEKEHAAMHARLSAIEAKLDRVLNARPAAAPIVAAPAAECGPAGCAPQAGSAVTIQAGGRERRGVLRGRLAARRGCS